MDPKEALRHIRTLIKVAAITDDIALVHKHLREMLVIVEKGLEGSNVVPLRPG
jgi:hypothetical protein